MMAEGDFDSNPQMLKDASAKISTSSADMETMIDEFLVASSLASNAVHFNLTVFDIGGALRGVLAKLIPVAAQKHIELKSETAPEALIVNGDPDYLNRVFSIVIDNAIRYTPDNGTITAKLGLSEDKSKIRFEVSDTGIGMTPDTISKLFSQFLRAENAFKFYVWGNGLGLYIAKQIIDAHHGTIHASSLGEGKGSAFVIELPTISGPPSSS